MSSDDALPDLTNVPKPPKVYPKLNRRLRIAMWIAFIGGPLMIAMGGYEYYRTSRLKSEGESVPGELVENNTLDTGKGRTSYRVTLDYRPPNGEITYRKEFFVTDAIYNQAVQARQLSVTYLPADPSVSAAGGDIPLKTEPFVIGGGLVLFGLAVLYYRRRQLNRVQEYLVGEE